MLAAGRSIPPRCWLRAGREQHARTVSIGESPVKFKIPETLEGLTRAQLVELETKAIESFDATRDDENLDAKGMAELRRLATFIKDVRGIMTAMDEASKAEADE